MYKSDVKVIADSAVVKYELSKNDPKKYFLRAVIAGFFLVVAIILSYVSSALFHDTNPAAGKILCGFLFPTAIILILFIGGELFTGNNMTMSVGVFEKRLTWKMAARVWVLSYIGNFVGSVLLGFLFAKSGASKEVLSVYLKEVVTAKLSIPAYQMVLRGILCNFMVCIAVVVCAKMKTEIGKLFVMTLVIMSFIVAGFEHSIANMGSFSIAYFLLGGLPMKLVLKSMFFVTIGNMIGGGLLLGWPISAMAMEDAKEKKEKQADGAHAQEACEY